MRGRVLVTRPEPGASQTARRLQSAGFSPIVLPLSETHRLPVDEMAVAARFDAAAVTSVNAISHAPRELIQRFAGRRCYAVGGKTAAAAREAGFADVAEGPGGASGLAAMIALDLAAGTTVLYLCGRVRLPDFEAALGEAGIGVRAVETYDTVELDYATDFVGRRIGGRPVDAVLLYSARAAGAFAKTVGRPELAHLFENTGFFCLSSRVAAALAGRSGVQIHIASEPTEDALLSVLERAS